MMKKVLIKKWRITYKLPKEKMLMLMLLDTRVGPVEGN